MKHFIKVILIVAVIAGLVFAVWRSGLGKDIQYVGPLETLITNTFDPESGASRQEQEKAIGDMMAKSQRKISANEAVAADHYTVQICAALLDVYRQREIYANRSAQAGQKKYSGLKGGKQTPDRTKAAISASLQRQQDEFEQRKREYCNDLLNKLRQAPRSRGRPVRPST